MPWIHFYVGYKGNVNACCVSSIKYGNINQQSINEIWHSESIKNIREQFLKGGADKRCSVCINREKSGAKSLRQETFEKYPNVNIQTISSPIYFDIRFSNVCNFKCRTCWHGASSKWFEDAKILKSTASHQAIINNIRDFDKFISLNGASLKQAKEIYFAGGEPLVTEEHYLLLDFLINHHLTDVKLRYNTNFSVLKFKTFDVLHYWKQFKSIEILASVDESNQLGEYIRKGLDWEGFLDNTEKINHLSNIQFKIAPTVSVFNVKTLPEFYKKCLQLNIITPTDFYINILDRPFHYNCKILSKKDKENVNQMYNEFYKWCQQNKVPKSIIEEFKSVQSFMNAEDLFNKHHSKFIQETEKIDELRDEKLF
jgi:MoaA/NifB/PqqE/SkfB family radical SAM enzyme